MKVDLAKSVVPEAIKVPVNKEQVKNFTEHSFKDELKLSEEAISMSKGKGHSKELEEIRQRVKNGYYDQSNVVDQVAESILKSDELS